MSLVPDFDYLGLGLVNVLAVQLLAAEASVNLLLQFQSYMHYFMRNWYFYKLKLAGFDEYQKGNREVY